MKLKTSLFSGLCGLFLFGGLSACMTGLTDKKVSGYALMGGSVYTMDDQNTIAQALVMKGNKIVYVGNRESAKKFLSDDIKIIKTKGQMILPGFIDTHSHVISAFPNADDLRFKGDDNIEDWLEQLRRYVRQYPDKKIIHGFGFSALAFGEAGPHKSLLDEIESKRAVILADNGGHTLWVNSLTLALAGITLQTLAETPETTAFYHRDSQGKLTGWLRGSAAIFHLFSKLPKALTESEALDTEAYYARVKKLWAYMNSLGLTSVFDAHMNGQEAKFGTILTALDRAGKLPFRIVGTHPVFDPKNLDTAIERLQALQQNHQSKRLRFGAIKLALDGTIESRTAGLLTPYAHDSTNKGDEKFSREKLMQFVIKADAAGVDLYMHSIGDRTTRNALDAIAAARRINNSIGTTRHTLSHLHLVDKADLPRFAQLDVMAQTTPIWHSKVPGYADALGMRADRLFSFNAIVKTGARVIFGSDYPVAGLAPLVPVFNIETGHTRREIGLPASAVLLPKNERLSVQQLIKGYTRDAAAWKIKSAHLKWVNWQMSLY
ncbi:MAG: amidohydrolase [Nitrospirae bacterium]|nr:amidohydrolase [Candidatus Manganitrophaceae bacterium]